MAPAAVTVARSALLSNQFPPLYDAASGGHHLALTPRLVGFIRLVVILCVLRYLGCRPVVKLHLANIAAHFTSPRGGVLFMGGVCVGHCAAISGFWAASRARFAQYRSTHLQGEVGSPVQPGLSDKYCAALLPVLGLDRVSGMRYRSTHLGRGARHVRELGSPVQPGLSDE